MSLITGKFVWIFLAFLCAIFDTSSHLLTKKALCKSGRYLVPASMCLTAGLVCLFLLFAVGIPKVDLSFFLMVIFVGVLAAIGLILFTSGLEKTDISYAVPLLCVIPLLTALWGWIFIGEKISYLGLLGIVVVMAGAYMLEIHRMKDGIFEPIKAISANAGARSILAASILWSFTSVLDKVAVLKASPMMWSCCISLTMGVIVLLVGLFAGKITKEEVSNSSFVVLISLGVAYAGMHFCQMGAIAIGQISYVISIKRLGILISVIIGSLIFKEPQFKERLIASLVMISGVYLIILYA